MENVLMNVNQTCDEPFLCFPSGAAHGFISLGTTSLPTASPPTQQGTMTGGKL
jgi:hypothetical protein